MAWGPTVEGTCYPPPFPIYLPAPAPHLHPHAHPDLHPHSHPCLHPHPRSHPRPRIDKAVVWIGQWTMSGEFAQKMVLVDFGRKNLFFDWKVWFWLILDETTGF